MRKTLVTLVLAVGLSFCGVNVGAKEYRAEEKPYNVLLLVFDDLGRHTASYGDANARKFGLTPNLDRLADMSLQFNQSFCQVSICGPSRASFLTGLRPDLIGVNTDHRYGARYEPETTPKFFELIETHPTLLNLFRDNGYFTARCGKIHHRFGVRSSVAWEPTSYERERDAWPRLNTREFRQFADEDGLPNLYQDPENPVAKSMRSPWGSKEVIQSVPSWEMHYAYDKDNPWRNRNTLWAERAMHAIERATEKGQPFLVAYGPTATHDPYCQPKEFADLIDPRELVLPETLGLTEREGRPVPFSYYGGIREWSDGRANWASWDDYLDRANVPDAPWAGDPLPRDPAKFDHEFIYRKMLQSYYASLAFVDYQVGRIIHTLEETGNLENTIILAFGDHGFHIFDHDVWNKTTNFHFASRTLTYLRVPGLAGNGKQSDGLVEFVDFYPTLADLCGIEAPENLNGHSLRALMEQPEREWKPYAFHQFWKDGQMGYTIRNRDFRYTAWLDDPNGRAYPPGSGEDYGPVEFEELYDLRNDPNETENVAGRKPFESLQRQLRVDLFRMIENPAAASRHFAPSLKG